MGKCPLNWGSKMDRILVGIVTREKEMETEGKPCEWNGALETQKHRACLGGTQTTQLPPRDTHTSLYIQIRVTLCRALNVSWNFELTSSQAG